MWHLKNRMKDGTVHTLAQQTLQPQITSAATNKCSSGLLVHASSNLPMYASTCLDAVEAHSCVDIVAKFTNEQYTTINQSTAGRFDPRVFVNCLLVEGNVLLVYWSSVNKCSSRLLVYASSNLPVYSGFFCGNHQPKIGW